MQLANVRTAVGDRAARVDDDTCVILPCTMRELLTDDLWDIAGADDLDGVAFERIARDAADLAPLISDPDKIVCVGLNYAEHVAEMGRALPTHPTYFSKFSGALIGARDDIELPKPDVSVAIDWEVELAIVIGAPARHVRAADALDHVAGYTICNDVSVRDWQTRSVQFLAGKTFEHTTPLGPVMTTADVLGDGSGLAVRTEVDGVTKQSSTTDELVFGVADLVADLSTIITLLPGDIIATGTPSGVGAGRDPQEWLTDGAELVTSIEGIGTMRNRCRIA